MARFEALRGQYFTEMRGLRDVTAEQATATRRSNAGELRGRERLELFDGLAGRRSAHIYEISRIGQEVEAARNDPEMRGALLHLLGQHETEVAQQEALRDTGTADEVVRANDRLRLLTWRQNNDPFLISARSLVNALGPDSGVLAGTVLPRSLGADVLEQQKEEDRRRNCRYEVYPEQLTALEAYLAVRADNTSENRRAFGVALAGLQHKNEAGDLVPLTHIGMALKSLTDHAVRMLEERTNPHNERFFRKKPGEDDDTAFKRGVWRPVTEREQAVWDAIVELQDPRHEEQHQIVIDRHFGRDYRAWYRGQIVPREIADGEKEDPANLNNTDVRAAFYEIHPLKRQTRARRASSVASPNGAASNGATPEAGEQAPASPYLTDNEVFALAAMLTQVHGTDIVLPGESKAHMQFTLPADIVNSCMQLTRAYVARNGRMDDIVAMQSRAGAVKKLTRLLEDEHLIETQETTIPQNGDSVAPTDILQYILITLYELQHGSMVGFVPELLHDMQVVPQSVLRASQVDTRDPFSYTSVGDIGRAWRASQKFAQALANGEANGK